MADADIVEVIYSDELTDSIKDVIIKMSHSKDFWLLDDNGLDLMHHAILAGNEEMVSLLNEMLTESSDEILEMKRCAGYLSLGCILGNENIVGVLCDGPHVDVRGGIENVHWPSVDVVKQCIAKSTRVGQNNGHRVADIVHILTEVTQQQASSCYNVIDLAAVANHIECVRAILRSSTVQYAVKRTTLLERALDLGSIHGFRLLLSHQPEKAEVYAAFQTALGRKLVSYVSAVLDHGIDVTDALDSINPYHFIYLCSPAFNRQRSAALVNKHTECGIDVLTALLVERGFDANSCDPPGTFPLYSLLASLIQEKDYNPGSTPVSHIRALELLLRADVRTDVDEMQLADETGISQADFSADAGRELASSALNAYFKGLSASDSWRPHVAEHLDRICLRLLEHGASASAVQNGTGSTPLHDLLHATATQHAVGHMHADLSTMARMLLYYGADPNWKNAAGEYPIEVYFQVLLHLMGGLIAFRRWKSSDNAAQVIHIMYFMDADDASVVRQRILSMLAGAKIDGMPDDVMQFVSSLTDQYVCTIKSLQELTKLVLWKAVRRRVSSVKEIHMPRAFISGISDLFSLDLE